MSYRAIATFFSEYLLTYVVQIVDIQFQANSFYSKKCDQFTQIILTAWGRHFFNLLILVVVGILDLEDKISSMIYHIHICFLLCFFKSWYAVFLCCHLNRNNDIKRQ